MQPSTHRADFVQAMRHVPGASAHASIVQASTFSMHVVPASDAEVVAIFSAGRGLPGRIGQRLFQMAVAALACVLKAGHIYGTHSTFIGRIDTASQSNSSDALLCIDGGDVSARAS